MKSYINNDYIFSNEQTDEKWKDAQYIASIYIDNDNSLFIYTHDTIMH